MSELPVTMRMTRVSSTTPQRGGTYHIEIIDERSRACVLSAYLTAEQFARVITGQSTDGIIAECDTDGRVGKIRQQKTVSVPHPPINPDFGNALRAAATEYEVDGWIANPDKSWNSHRGDRDTYPITFYRYVDAEEQE